MKNLFVLCAVLLTSVVGCGSNAPPAPESTLMLKVASVHWEYPAKNEILWHTTVVFDNGGYDKDRYTGYKLRFDGIHDFKVGKEYKIVVKTNNAELISFQETIKKDTPPNNDPPPPQP